MGVRKGDKVVVIAGKDRGKEGKIIDVVKDGKAVVVDGVNIQIKHKKARSAQQKSAREKMAGPIDVSNVMVLCKCGKATRIAHKIDAKGNKTRVCTKCGETLDRKYVKAKEKAKEVEQKTDDTKKDDTVAKKPLVRREVKNTATSTIKKPQATKTVTGVRKVGGGS